MRTSLLALCAFALALAAWPVHAANMTKKDTSVLTSPEELTLDEVIERSLENSPQLKGMKDGINAERGTFLQMGQRPNPVLALDAENVFGTRSTGGMKSAEYTASIQQTFETGGKRAARVALGTHLIAVASVGYRTGVLNVARDVAVLWAEMIYALEKVSLAEKQKSLANEMLKSVSTRVEAAAEPAIQKSKAEVAYNNSRIGLEKALLNLSAARKSLSQLSGLPETVKLDKRPFYKIAPPPADAGLERNPDVAGQKAQTELAKAAVKLEQANASQDVTFGVGVRDSRDSNSQSFVGGISMPLPFFNRNQGAIARSMHEESKAQQDLRQKKIEAETSLSTAMTAMHATYVESKGLKEEILPAAERAFTQARQGYKAGKYPYLEVLDAQRTLAEVREQYIDALKNYQVSKAVVDRLTGHYAELVPSEGIAK